MADHMRTQIREAAVARLKTVTRAPWGNRVYPSRRMPFAESDLPALCVYTTEENSTLDTGNHLRRQLDLVIEAVAQDNADLDGRLDGLAAAVEAALGADRKLGGLAYDTTLTRTTVALQPPRDAQFKTGSAVLTFLVSYRTPVADPSANAI